MFARLANQSGATIISVAYQKAPEHPFPTPFDDCYAVPAAATSFSSVAPALLITAHFDPLLSDGKKIQRAIDFAAQEIKKLTQ